MSGAKTILVIDDEPGILDIISTVLSLEGFPTRTASNGREALDLVGDLLPDLILLDMMMPVMDGWEFTREFRSRYDNQVPIVVLTAASDAKSRAEEIGAAGWVGKPFDLETLTAVVRRVLKQRQ